MKTRVSHFGTTRILRWGHGLGVRIPLSLARKVGLEDGATVDLLREGRRILIEPQRDAPTLAQLLAGVTCQNLHPDLGWRSSEGRESDRP